MKHTDVIVHVGYGKTATTWLQEKIFSTLPDIYLGKREGDFPSWLLRFNYLDDAAFLSQKDTLRNEIATVIANRDRVLMSSEAFTNFGVVFQQMSRLADIFEQPRIILALRHPIDWLYSNYKYCVEYEGFTLPLEAYLDFGENRTPFSLEKRAPFYLPDLFYNEVVERYQSLFGHDNVLVLKYEDFVQKPQQYGQALEQFIGTPLPDFSQVVKEKVLVSKSGSSLAELRAKNIKNEIEQFGCKVSDVCFPETNDIMSDALKDKLTAYMLPHCSEFY